MFGLSTELITKGKLATMKRSKCTLHDLTSFQLSYTSCINKGNLPTYLPTYPSADFSPLVTNSVDKPNIRNL